ncbi:hypothetical protein, partial [Wohlfahrtiimonas populi]|uniref:hypothetical protein n=1 Tax=Wohlfahrtiimonas populi TaxID=1940240 RepID=UPI00117FBA62
MSNKRWFAYSDIHGMEIFTSESEAREKTEFLIQDLLEIDGAWNESVESVCFGKVVAIATKENERTSDN